MSADPDGFLHIILAGSAAAIGPHGFGYSFSTRAVLVDGGVVVQKTEGISVGVPSIGASGEIGLDWSDLKPGTEWENQIGFGLAFISVSMSFDDKAEITNVSIGPGVETPSISFTRALETTYEVTPYPEEGNPAYEFERGMENSVRDIYGVPNRTW